MSIVSHADETAVTLPGATVTLARANRARRGTAFLIDISVAALIAAMGLLVPHGLGPLIRKGIIFRLITFGPAIYLLLRDAVGGRSLGKLALGLMTWDVQERRPAGLIDSVIRNWPLAVLAYPVVGPIWFPLLWPIWALQAVAAVFTVIIAMQVVAGSRRRLFDRTATTQVIEERWQNSSGGSDG